MKKISIYTCVFTRSEEGPLYPLLKEMKRRKDFEVTVRKFDMAVMDRLARIKMMEWDMTVLKPSMVLCGFDRPEMVDLAYSAHHMNIPIAQIFAGDISGGAFDDADRFAISTYADLLFCADDKQFDRLQKAFAWKRMIGQNLRVFKVGATHFDDMEYDDLVADKTRKYALVLYNPPNKGEIIEQVYRDVEYISNRLADKINSKKIDMAYWVAPNGDYGSQDVKRLATSMRSVRYLENMPRKQFLGWMKHAKVLIGNSSCFFYEGCYFNKNVVVVGKRNAYRELADNCDKGASRKIIEHIRDFFNEGDK